MEYNTAVLQFRLHFIALHVSPITLAGSGDRRRYSWVAVRSARACFSPNVAEKQK